MRRNNELDSDHRSTPGIGRRARSLVALVAVSSLAAGAAMISAGSDASAQVSPIGSGLTSSDAAGSCWEIKQLHPSSANGLYWLRTSRIVRPEQFYCDMTTDGGGWVLIGRGRDGWTFRDYGQSTTNQLRDNVTGPAAFAPAALSSVTIDGLLDGGAVKDLPDGLRVRRAANTAGTSWQEMRWNFLDLGAWSWALGGGHRLSAYSIDGAKGTGSNTKDSSIKMWGETGAGNRSGTNLKGWFTYPWSGHNRQGGFSYRGTVSGERNDSSYLWEYGTENSALPFTQLFIRPKVTTPASTPVPDEGLAAETLTPMLEDRPAELAGGVRGVLKVGDLDPGLDAPVLAITTLGDRVYVGGKFADVRDTTTGNLVRHSYLAAFDRATGAWISSFRPKLDGAVWDLEIAGGRLVVAGQFTNINGAAGTSGMAALDPNTGAVDTTWQASFAVTGTTARPIITATDVEGDWIYVGGNFTRITTGSDTVAVGRVARLSIATGAADRGFRPNVNGVPYDVDAADGRIQLAGNLKGVNGGLRTGVASLDATTGDVIGGLAPAVFTSTDKQYQFAVLDMGAEIWQGGSEHNTQVYRESDYSLVKSYVTYDQGGDTQVLDRHNDKVVQGSHANAFVYENATTWPGVTNYTRTDIFNWVGMFDSTTHAYERDWVPGLGSAYTEGTWALHTDVDGCMWFGGDLLGGPFVNGQRQYLESFSKFCERDTVAPAVPGNAVAATQSGGGVIVKWGASSDNASGYVGYEVLRNDRVISPLIYGSTYLDPTGTPADRYFVRAVDAAGNRSATTTVLRPGDTLAPTTPQDLRAVVGADLAVTLTWTASTDDIRVESYRVFRNGAEIQTVPGDVLTATISGLERGRHSFQVQAVDNAGNRSLKTASADVELGGADVTAPSVPTSLVVTGDPSTGKATATWSASTDDVGVTAYNVYRNDVLLTTVAGNVTSVLLDVGYGDHYIAVAAKDATGNESAKSPSTLTTIVPPVAADTSNPSTPTNLAFVVNADGSVDLTWSASRDNVGVASYRVTRNNVEVAVVPGTETAAHLVTLGPGTHFLQVQAFDAAGNSSWKTPSVTAVVVAPPSPDTTNPSTPKDLVVTVLPNGSVDVAWSASRDNVGVASYRITRNNVEVLVVPGNRTTANIVGLGPGTHHIQVQAFDAAGNSSWKTPSSAAVI